MIRRRSILRVLPAAGLIVLLVTLGCAEPEPRKLRKPHTPRAEGEPTSEARNFDGASSDLKRTVFVPTLDTPLPKGKNAVWCASFQFAWNVLKDDVIGGPIRLANAGHVAERLNGAPVPLVPDDARYFAAGYATADLLGTIASEMQQRFPDAPPPRLNGAPKDIIAYAYLAANVAFRHPYHPDAGPFPFYEDGRDPPVMVKGFGFARHHGAPPHEGWVRQVGVLYAKNMHSVEEAAPPQFVLDLDQTSAPYQLLLARIAPGTTLGATIHEMEAHIAAYAAGRERPDTITGDELYVPFLDWRIKHRFHELEGSDKAFQNPGFEGFHIDEAHQMVDFQLDQGGARLTSQAVIHGRSGPRRFAFGDPFLVLLRVRGEKLPFFVTWIQNAELLTKV